MAVSAALLVLLALSAVAYANLCAYCELERAPTIPPGGNITTFSPDGLNDRKSRLVVGSLQVSTSGPVDVRVMDTANWDLYVNGQPHQDLFASSNTMLVNTSLILLPCADAQVVVFIVNQGNEIVTLNGGYCSGNCTAATGYCFSLLCIDGDCAPAHHKPSLWWLGLLIPGVVIVFGTVLAAYCLMRKRSPYEPVN